MNVPVAVASSSQLAADAGAAVAGRGGNAVDAAIAAALASMSTEPGVCGLGGGGFVTVWPSNGPAVVVDGYAAAPGLGLPAERLGTGGVEVFVQYGGGVRTIVGPGAVATPGAVAALGESSERFGALAWAELFGPVIEAVERGFPLPKACHHYLEASADCVFGQDRDGWDCLHDENGHLKPPGATIRVPHLADSLRRLARRGPRELYTGGLGRMIADHVQARGGTLTRRDLSEYRAKLRVPMVTPVNGWHVATNPPPALGGVILTAMLTLLAGEYPCLPQEPVARQIAVQKLVLGYRQREVGGSRSVERDIDRLMASVKRRDLHLLGSPSTVQASAGDGTGLGCSITMSTGYSSGLMPAGTGIWLNNCLGELELIPEALADHPPVPGCRPIWRRPLPATNRAARSSSARRAQTASPPRLCTFWITTCCVANRWPHPSTHRGCIWNTTAIYSAWLTNRSENCPPAHPRRAPFGPHSMYFGGVAAVKADHGGRVQAAADPRRAGGTRVVGV